MHSTHVSLYDLILKKSRHMGLLNCAFNVWNGSVIEHYILFLCQEGDKSCQ